MNAQPRRRINLAEVSPFAAGKAARLARWLVPEMMFWPGLLGVFATALIVYGVRSKPLLWPLVALLLLAIFAAGRQWRVMWRTVVLPARPQSAKEASPRPISRGSTERPADEPPDRR